MGSLFSDNRAKEWDQYSHVPPPPGAPAPRAKPTEPIAIPEREVSPAAAYTPETSGARPKGHPFDAELDASEIDERGRPQQTWTARSRSLSRANLVIRSRRMTYPGREIVLAVHLIDGEPVGLYGRVATCEYDGEGQYVVDLDLMPLPERAEIRGWLQQVAG
jgi:hypothetical protein